MNIKVFRNADEVANEAARLIAGMARDTVAAKGRFVMAVSGGRTPWMMLRALGQEDVPWESIHVVQVDERVAPSGHQDRNLTHLRESLLENSPLSEANIHPMPVESEDLISAVTAYASTLCEIAGTPPVLDLVHLGLGSDGHTASLIPGDPVLKVDNQDVAITGLYQGRLRMTLTYPAINRARHILWVITGSEKIHMLKCLVNGDSSIPAGLIYHDQALILTDLQY
jgi:6-phosphogluconolactonase